MGFTIRDPLLQALPKLEQEQLVAQVALAKLKGPTSDQLAGVGPKRRLMASTPLGEDDPYRKDFRNFLTMVWRFLGLPDPSPVQLSLAWWLQHGPARAVILGFRGMAKSWITGAFILWTLYCDPQKKILVVSASLDRAVQTVQWCLALIREMPSLQHLRPGALQRQSGKQFDVGPALPDQSPSLRGAGITGQITGSRAHLIVPDDVEIPANSMTVLMREKIAEVVKEFDAVLHPNGLVKFLGTPQTDDSLYPKLSKRGYTIRVWPARYPDKKMRVKYGERLSPYLLKMVEQDPTLVGHSVWPGRFSDEDLNNRELSYGRSGFALQFMLDTSLSDADRYPLKLRDLIVEPLDLERGPDVIVWSNDQKNSAQGLPNMGFDGDHYYGPASKSEVYSPYTQVIGALDPSGRGGDETSLSIVGELHGRLFLLFNGAWRDGYAPKTLQAIAQALIKYQVRKLVIEDNFGDGMFIALLQPVLIKAWRDYNMTKKTKDHMGTEVEGIRSQRTQKEIRILSVLEPATQQHRLVVATACIEQDYKSLAQIDGDDLRDKYSLWHQFTHITRERDSLLHDDRLESLALAVSQYAEVIGINPWDSAEQAKEDRVEEELERLFADADDAVSVGRGRPSRGNTPKAIPRAGPSRNRLH